MASTYPDLALTTDLQSLLAGLRWRIRLYIWLEGLSLAVIWLAAMFWVGFGLDYLPVLMGASEMPAARPRRPAGRHRRRPGRPSSTAGFSAGRSSAWATAAWRCSWSGDSSSFTTAWSRPSRWPTCPTMPPPSTASCSARTTNEARAGVGDVRYLRKSSTPARWLGSSPLAAADGTLGRRLVRRQCLGAFEQAAAAAVSAQQRALAAQRQIEVVGIEVLRDRGPRRRSPPGRSRFPSRTASSKVAKGANVSLKVRAAQAPAGPSRAAALHHLLPHAQERRRHPRRARQRHDEQLPRHRAIGATSGSTASRSRACSRRSSSTSSATTTASAAIGWKSSIARRSSRRCST